MKKSLLMLLAAVVSIGQEQRQPIQDLNLIIGKKVVVQRVALCQPGTFTTDRTYAGKQGKVVSLKPYKFPVAMTQSVLNMLTPEQRAMMENLQKASTILLEFNDGIKLDSCGPIGPSNLSDYFELAPGETLPSTAAPIASEHVTPPASLVSPTNAWTQPISQVSPDVSLPVQSAGGGWSVVATKGDMTDTPGSTFLLYSESTVEDGITSARPNLAIVCESGRFRGATLDTGLVLGAETHESVKFMQFQTQQQYVTLRLDNKIVDMSWDTMGTKELGIGKRDLEKILKAKNVRIKFPVFIGTAPVATFQPSGLDRDTLNKSCGMRF